MFWLAGGAAGLVIVLGAVFGIVWAAHDSGSSGSVSAPRPNSASAGANQKRAGLFTGSDPVGQIDAQGKLGPDGAPPYPAVIDGATCNPVSIAMVGALTGPNAALGQNVLHGIKLMLDQFGRSSPQCSITLKQFDTGGDPATAVKLAPQIVADSSVVAVIGPVFSGETKAAGKIFDDAGLPFLTPAATNVSLTTFGWRNFFRGLADDDLQGRAVGRYLTGTAGYRRICVLADNSDYGAGLAYSITGSLGAVAMANCAATIPMNGDPADAVNKVAAAGPDAVYYAGYYDGAGAVVQRLRKAGVTAPFVTGDGSYVPAFVTAAGADASGTLVSCPCGPLTDRFIADYQTLNLVDVGAYSAEAYDLTAIVLRGIAAAHTWRPSMLGFLQTYHGDGIAHTYGWTATGELSDPRVWLYKLQ